MSVGMPAALYLEQFGSIIWDVFGHNPYLVGSALAKKEGWRDVDVRMILDDKEWGEWFPDLPPDSDEAAWQKDAKWIGITLAFSELGKRLTGMPIDFQVQPQTYANKAYGSPEHPRSALGRVPWRFASRLRSGLAGEGDREIDKAHDQEDDPDHQEDDADDAAGRRARLADLATDPAGDEDQHDAHDDIDEAGDHDRGISPE